MEMSVGMLDHYNVSTRKLGDTIRFYEEVLGLTNGPRPPFNFPGAWLYSAGHPVLHLNDISSTDRQQPADSGVIDHVAFGSRGFEAIKQHLTGKGVSFRVNQVPNSRRWQIFLTDPNNVMIELNFDVANERAAAPAGAKFHRAAAFATCSAMKRGSANAATCTSGVQYFVGKLPAFL